MAVKQLEVTGLQTNFVAAKGWVFKWKKWQKSRHHVQERNLQGSDCCVIPSAVVCLEMLEDIGSYSSIPFDLSVEWETSVNAGSATIADAREVPKIKQPATNSLVKKGLGDMMDFESIKRGNKGKSLGDRLFRLDRNCVLWWKEVIFSMDAIARYLADRKTIWVNRIQNRHTYNCT